MYIPKESKKSNGNNLIGDWQLTKSNPTSANAWKNIWQQDFNLTCGLCNDNEDICNDRSMFARQAPSNLKLFGMETIMCITTSLNHLRFSNLFGL